jgi:hypothetical protein
MNTYLHRTGRTTKMLEEIIKQLYKDNGRQIVIVCANEKHKRFLYNKLCLQLELHKIDYGQHAMKDRISYRNKYIIRLIKNRAQLDSLGPIDQNNLFVDNYTLEHAFNLWFR